MIFTAFALYIMQQDNFGLKIDLKSIIESKTLPIIVSEFWDWFHALASTVLKAQCHVQDRKLSVNINVSSSIY